MNRTLFRVLIYAIAACASGVLLFPIVSYACGFHSSFIAKAVTPREWWEYHKHEYIEESKPAPQQQVSGSGEMQPAVFKESRGTPSRETQGKQRALIAMVLNHLLYLNSTNVNPDEFPDFNVKSIPEYARNFKEILVELGSDAVPFILDAYLDTMRSQAEDAMGLKRNEDFQADMVEVLTRIGRASVAEIAACAARTPGKRERDALVALIAKILQPDQALKALPTLVRNALDRWPEFGQKIIALAEDALVRGPEQAAAMGIWLAASFEKAGETEIFALLRDPARKEELRCIAVGFLSDKGRAKAVREFLSIALKPEEGLYVRRECLSGIWRIRLMSPNASMQEVRLEAGIKSMILSAEAPKVLRVLAIYLLSHLRDESLLDTLIMLLHREGEDEGVLMAALEGIEILGLQPRASARIDAGMLMKRAHIAAFRFKLLGICTSSADPKLAGSLVRIILAEDEYPPMRVKAFAALHGLRKPGFAKAEQIVLEKTDFVDRLADFVFDRSISNNERAGVLKDLETLSALQVRGPVSALFSSNRAEVALRSGGLPDDMLATMLEMFLKWKGSSATSFVASLLDDPGTPQLVLLKSAEWAGRWMVTELAENLRKARARSQDPSFRLAAVVALSGMGERHTAAEIAALMFPKSGQGPDPETFAAGLDLLGKIGDRDAMNHLVRCVKPAHEGDFVRTAAALAVLSRKGSDARPWFAHVWSSFRKTELGNTEARTAFQECMRRMGPSQEICDALAKQMRLEIQRLPFTQSGVQPGPGDESIEGSRSILPPLHATSMMNAFMTGSSDMFDIGRANAVQAAVMAWYQNIRKDLPKE